MNGRIQSRSIAPTVGWLKEQNFMKPTNPREIVAALSAAAATPA
jgi:hypothetical protein